MLVLSKGAVGLSCSALANRLTAYVLLLVIGWWHAYLHDVQMSHA